MPNLLSVSQAKKLTGKSESTFKRMVREIVADPKHSDRAGITPGHEEIERLRGAGERYTWGISQQLLQRRFPKEAPQAVAGDSAADPDQPVTANKLVEILQEQLGKKDQQINALERQLDRKDEQFAILSERQRESNILMKSLQERMAIEASERDLKKKGSWLSRFTKS